MSESSHPPRPSSRSRVPSVRDWILWFGVPRLVVSAVAVVVVGLGGWWLVRSEPPVEAGLPMMSLPSTIPSVEESTTTTVGTVLVHVAGAVRRSGLYELSSGDRVDDAVRAAGGVVPEADLDGVNLAAVVVDGQRVYVPVEGEVDPVSVPSGASPAESATPAGPVDVNTATAEELTVLPGVGPATARAIVEDRERNGPFGSVDDLDRVPGIGPGRLAALDGLVTV